MNVSLSLNDNSPLLTISELPRMLNFVAHGSDLGIITSACAQYFADCTDTMLCRHLSPNLAQPRMDAANVVTRNSGRRYRLGRKMGLLGQATASDFGNISLLAESAQICEEHLNTEDLAISTRVARLRGWLPHRFDLCQVRAVPSCPERRLRDTLSAHIMRLNYGAPFLQD